VDFALALRHGKGRRSATGLFFVLRDGVVTGDRSKEGLKDRFKHSINVVRHVAVPKSQHSEALTLKDSRPLLVVSNVVGVLRSIYFNDQALPYAAKIDDKSLDGVLPSEARTVEVL
jgi:hypothetical protein